ncbi:MAG: hypothetical protein ACK5Z2_14740 [Bacteroidota bacterium]
MRAYLGDPGNVPRSTAYPLSASPDLIPYGVSPADPATFLTDTSWNKAYSTTMVKNADNYMYMRAQNLATTPITGTFSLFSTNSNLLLWPSTWSQNQLRTQSGEPTQQVTIAAGQRGVVPSAFIWHPTTLEHYCLVGMVDTPSHPATIPPDGSITNFALWIAQNGNFAWHNLSVTDVGSPTWSKTINYIQGDTAYLVKFELVCKNVPVGSIVRLTCGAAGISPPLDVLGTVTSSTNYIIGMECDVDADFQAEMSYSYTAVNGQPPPAGFEITFRASIMENGEAVRELYQYCSTLEESGIPTPEDYLERAQANRKWDTLPWSVHESYADYLLREHKQAGTYQTGNSVGPQKRFVVGSDTSYAQIV